jgi:hypothetical protein
MDQRYEYEIVRVPIKSKFWSGEITTDYQEVIHERAKEGWRLSTIFAPAVMSYGGAKVADLIFERPRH